MSFLVLILCLSICSGIYHSANAQETSGINSEVGFWCTPTQYCSEAERESYIWLRRRVEDYLSNKKYAILSIYYHRSVANV